MEILVSTEWLQDQLGADDLVVLDASAHLLSAERDPKAEYANGHIRGARYLDLPKLKDDRSTLPATIPTGDQFSERLRELGIRADDRVVLYDDSMLRSAARAYLIFKLFGFEQVAVLDGGLGKWKAESRPVSNDPVTSSPSDYRVLQNNSRKIRSKGEMLANCDVQSEQVIDARDAARFTGEVDDAVHGLAGGHIPGARNVFFRDLLAENGTFIDSSLLRAAFETARVDLTKPITASCGSGMTASVVLFALELLGHQQTTLYDGSWSEWGSDPDTPKETGSAR